MTLHIVLIFVTQWMYFLLGTGEPKLDYHPPLDIPLTLAANFGELRSNHFHMGIDLKTQGKEGLSLYSIDDGYISRVNISPYGYGLTVYINHSGGITSVYAHCSELIGKLDSKIKSIQKEKKSSEIEVYFGPNEMPIKRAEIFALSGNSGSSRGPHLHFEIRDSYTDEAFNPLLFGFKIADSRKPELRHLKLFSLDENAFSMNGTKEYKIYKKGDQYVLDAPIQISPSFFSKKGGIGFALSGVDFYDAYNNVCGLYGLKLSIHQ
ncbi:MAG: M23 family metallopeptidase, partial [Bacteroidetes bacterium]|nr:M23 family metallopeptidase [Bacteroidota bacterium]